ncbi:MAG: hypothetical protein TU35_007835 [Thermoproteus sp. AZ2]|uniref:Uncharacterized protein n=1 Tax=Thermoproteus sp. AZ2 TaxID=1609232 RepID=A0ACC6V2Y2_9CREN
MVAAREPCLGPRCVYGPNGSSLFRCGKKALKPMIRGNKIVFWCTWLNDECIGPRCQYAYCEARALTPDGFCTIKTKGVEEKRPDILIEAKKMEGEVKKIEQHLKKYGLKDYL